MEQKTRLLLIDDEAALLRLMQTYLARIGYDVETCAQADEALSIVSNAGESLQLAIVDLSLMDGPESLAALARANRAVRLLICSGHPFEVAALPADVRHRFDFLQKPFLPNMLAGAVEQLLERKLPANGEPA